MSIVNVLLFKLNLIKKIFFCGCEINNDILLNIIIRFCSRLDKIHYHYNNCLYCNSEHNYVIDKYCYEGMGNEFITRAIKTKNLETVKIACQIALRYYIEPDTSETSKNALTNAVLTGDPEIVKEIMIIGGLPNNILFWCNDDDYGNINNVNGNSNNTFETMHREYIINNNHKNNTHIIEELIDLIMCSGASLSYMTFFQICLKENKNHIDLKIINYCAWKFKSFVPYDIKNTIITEKTKKNYELV